MNYTTHILIAGLLCLCGCNKQGGSTPKPAGNVVVPATKEGVVSAYAAHVFEQYETSLASAQERDQAIKTFMGTPSQAGLEKARTAWIAARRDYSPTEVFRFYGGPIDSAKDGVEGFLNAWPVDESYIDYVEGQPKAGIVNNDRSVPLISPDVLQVINEKGGEANVSCGWHAIEFLLWGQDLDPNGPGARPHTDFIDGDTRGAARRAEYLEAASTLLLQHLTQVRDAWRPGEDNYRKAFEADSPDESLRKIFTGMCVLFGFELSGERMNVAFETGDQEDEHSCFSDTTHNDIADNAAGVFGVYKLLRPLAQKTDAELAAQLDELETKTRSAIEAIPAPFDQTVTSKDPAKRKLIMDGINALEDHAIALSALAHGLGYPIPLRPE